MNTFFEILGTITGTTLGLIMRAWDWATGKRRYWNDEMK
jgi:hypothetical protein